MLVNVKLVWKIRNGVLCSLLTLRTVCLHLINDLWYRPTQIGGGLLQVKLILLQLNMVEKLIRPTNFSGSVSFRIFKNQN